VQKRDFDESDSGFAAAFNTSCALSPRLWELLAEKHQHLPVWVRAPKVGTEFFSGLSRSKLYDGASRGHFRSVSIREPGQVKGTRLFHLQSILDYIALCEESYDESQSGNEKQ
jgi:hypothetical protein